MAATPTDDLLERLKDPAYAKLYGAEDAKVDFAITLTKARKILNLTQKSLADKLGISQPYVAKLESGEANPTLGRVGSLLATIDLRLVTGTAPLKPEPIPFSEGGRMTLRNEAPTVFDTINKLLAEGLTLPQAIARIESILRTTLPEHIKEMINKECDGGRLNVYRHNDS